MCCLLRLQPLEKTGLPIVKGEHTPYKLSVGKTDYQVRHRPPPPPWVAGRQARPMPEAIEAATVAAASSCLYQEE